MSLYIYWYSGTQVFMSTLIYHSPCCVPPSSMEGFFFQKELPKTLFMRETFGKNLWRGVHGETNDQTIGGARCIFQ